MVSAQEPKYRLVASRRGARVSGEVWTADPAREASLPEKPASMDALDGSYQLVSRRAVELNRKQIQSGFVDYLFAPELIA